MAITNEFERDLSNQAQLKRPGRVDMVVFQNVPDAGDGSPGIQRCFRNYLHEGGFENDLDLLGYAIKGTSVNISNAEMQQLSNIEATTISAAQWVFVGEANQAVKIADSPTFGGLALTGNLTLAGNSITGTSVNINNAELQQLSNITANTISETQWGYLGVLDQTLVKGTTPTFVGLILSADIVTTSTVDGVDIATLSSNYTSHSSAGNPHSTSEPSFSKNTAFNKNFGTSTNTLIHGNDSRLSNDRTPITHAMSTHTNEGNHVTHNYGTTGSTVCQGNDSRLSNNRTPISHGYAYHSDINQALLTTSTPTFAQLTVGVLQFSTATGKIYSSSAMTFESEGSMTFKPDNASVYVWKMTWTESDDADFFQNGASSGTPQGNVGREGSTNRPLLKCLAKYLEDDGTGTSAYSHVDDLQLLRETKEWKVRKKSVIPDHPDYKQSVFDIKTLPWIKAVPELDSFTGDSDELRYKVPIGSKIGYLLSTMQKLLKRQDDLVNGLAARDLIIDSLITRLDTLENK